MLLHRPDDDSPTVVQSRGRKRMKIRERLYLTE